MRIGALSFLLALLLTPAEAFAQDAAALRIKSLATARTGTGAHADSMEAGLGDWVRVEVEGLSAAAKSGSVKPATLLLYLDGRPLPGLQGTLFGPTGDWLEFRLQRTDASKEAWVALLGRPTHDHRPVRVSVGPEAGPEFAGVGDSLPRFNLIVYHRTALYVCLALSAVLLYAFWVLARRSNILRDRLPATAAAAAVRPYSLAKFQMAVWFVLIALSFGFIYAITWDYNSITDQALILMGIATLTALGGKVIDTNKAAAAAAAAAPGAAAPAATPTVPKRPSKSFLLDILSDENGISLHRFQMFVWTLVLGLLFVIGVYNDLAMPAFSGTLLTLLGISSGTYLGFKIPEGAP